MKTLASDRFAPITESIGFLNLPIAKAADALLEWRRELHGTVSAREVHGVFPDVLRNLEPLSALAERELLVSVGPDWTAYFDNYLGGSDPVGAIGVLTKRAHATGFFVHSVPHVAGRGRGQIRRMGSVAFSMLAPFDTGRMNYVRTIQAVYSGSRWEFFLIGTEQPFEEVDRYRARKVRDRFTSDMLERYCQALGVDVFNLAAYGNDSILIESEVATTEPVKKWTLAEVQVLRNIVPGEADALPG